MIVLYRASVILAIFGTTWRMSWLNGRVCPSNIELKIWNRDSSDGNVML